MHPVVFWSFNDKKVVDVDADGNEIIRIIAGRPFLKYYTVFHIDQCEGIKPKFDTELKVYDNDPIEEAENIVKNRLLCCSGVGPRGGGPR